MPSSADTKESVFKLQSAQRGGKHTTVVKHADMHQWWVFVDLQRKTAMEPQVDQGEVTVKIHLPISCPYIGEFIPVSDDALRAAANAFSERNSAPRLSNRCPSPSPRFCPSDSASSLSAAAS